MLLFAQAKDHYKVRSIAFYNVENLFDTINDPDSFDDDRTPSGKDQWTSHRYQRKIENISKVISEIGADKTSTSPDLIGLCEIENRQVVEDLIAHPNLKNKGYGIIHYDSPDERGIDVALLYKQSAFIPANSMSRRLLLFNNEGERDYSRDQLVVQGYLDTEKIYLIVNHWPSRSGGEARSRPNRIAAANLNVRIMDSILREDSTARIITMGDFNDDPTDTSITKILKKAGVRPPHNLTTLHNPMELLHKKGLGSLAYRDRWNLFDQILMTPTLLNGQNNTFQFWKAGIYHPPYLSTPTGPYKGYPFRTYSGGNYTGGYSDHFPVVLYLIKSAK
ncbi:endonuclease/exonuclease/phosphatase family protein [Sediminicola sp. 1XM1-17]|uniref:endonuclease/exonuclease/phosphatase family protein n=1 Tax=Sediminicola sp. 1XM1-17 TaxID=3127702 RepID=UPI0030779E59